MRVIAFFTHHRPAGRTESVSTAIKAAHCTLLRSIITLKELRDQTRHIQLSQHPAYGAQADLYPALPAHNIREEGKIRRTLASQGIMPPPPASPLKTLSLLCLPRSLWLATPIRQARPPIQSQESLTHPSRRLRGHDQDALRSGKEDLWHVESSDPEPPRYGLAVLVRY